MLLQDLSAIVRRSPSQVVNLSMGSKTDLIIHYLTLRSVKSIVTLHATKDIEQDDEPPR